jgi:hypothetical protein
MRIHAAPLCAVLSLLAVSTLAQGVDVPVNEGAPDEPAAQLWQTGRIDGLDVLICPDGVVNADEAWARVHLTAQAAPPIVKLSDRVWHTEHCLYVVPEGSSVAWPDWNSVYSDANISAYVAELKKYFPGDYTTACIMANDLTPNKAPYYFTNRFKATGINSPGTPGGTDICMYNLGGGYVNTARLGVFDHEIGHGWGVRVGLHPGHWNLHSTAWCQMMQNYSDDNYATVLRILGTPLNGFVWTRVDNTLRQEDMTYSEQQLYLMGLASFFPDLFTLSDPAYKSDGTMGYSKVVTDTHTSVVAGSGVRDPDYRGSPKRFRVGFIYVARDFAEINTVFANVEDTSSFFALGESFDNVKHHLEVPFLYATRHRANLDALLRDLDGNATPTIVVLDPYVSTSSSSATVRYTADDPGGPPPTVTCLPDPARCRVQADWVEVSGLQRGANFFTLRAADAAGKKAFASFVVDYSGSPPRRHPRGR